MNITIIVCKNIFISKFHYKLENSTFERKLSKERKLKGKEEERQNDRERGGEERDREHHKNQMS